jgi:release factor glutamine methyltransferase
VASNPPDVSSAEFAKLPVTVGNFEPRQALEAGPRGTEIIERLVPAAAARLTTGGWLLMEISSMIEQAVRKLIETAEGFQQHSTIKDLAGLPRVAQARKK